ncbi:hypothetical protein K7C98_10655 [Nannocystis pusilla]|uniref:Uncharacterized protein n=1 Tax=Nannocystis pusilla TaxID=889268 RepID=A0ABS7TND0_9BACT|nr:hypothetical protein [Nannocystis pusilla]
MLDIRRGCDFVTVSWTKFTDSWKAVLVGGGSGEVESIGKQRLTRYNNYFLDCDHTLLMGEGMSPSIPVITGYSSAIFVQTVEPLIETPPGDFTPPYSYSPIPAEDVPAVVSAGAGATLQIE